MRFVFAALLLSAVPLTAQTCDRVCLRDFLDRYLDALVKHDPDLLPLSTTVRFTEDGVDLAPGQGLWKTASGLGDFRQDVLDVPGSTAGTHAIVMENGKPVLFVLRIKIFGLRIHELETAILRNPQQVKDTISVFSSAGEPVARRPDSFPLLGELSAAMSRVPQEGQVPSREELVEIADRHFVDPQIRIRTTAVDEEMGIIWQRVHSPRGQVLWVMTKLYGGLTRARHVVEWPAAAGIPSGWD